MTTGKSTYTENDIYICNCSNKCVGWAYWLDRVYVTFTRSTHANSSNPMLCL